MNTEDMVQEFAPSLRTSSQSDVFRIALQILGDLTGFGLGYFVFDELRGYIKATTEMSSDNSVLMRNVSRHERLLDALLADIGHALLHMGRTFDEGLPVEGETTCLFDDSIISDTAADDGTMRPTLSEQRRAVARATRVRQYNLSTMLLAPCTEPRLHALLAMRVFLRSGIR